MSNTELIARPCPFCSKTSNLKDDDTLYPSGIWWRERGGFRSYHGHKDRCEDDFQCWGMHCAETAGGCGASISGDGATDALEKWNKRSDALQALERVPDVEALIDDLSEWSRHVVEDTAHESLEKHVKRVLAHHGITPPESKG